MVAVLLVVVLIGIVGMVGLFAAGFLMNRSKVDHREGDR